MGNGRIATSLEEPTVLNHQNPARLKCTENGRHPIAHALGERREMVASVTAALDSQIDLGGTVQLALRDNVSGRSSSTRSCITLGVIRPRSPRSRLTRP